MVITGVFFVFQSQQIVNDAFSEFFEVEANQLEGQSLLVAKTKRRKRKGEKKLKKKSVKRLQVTFLS